MKRAISLLLGLVLAISLAIPAAAADYDTCFTDVTSDQWFYDDVRQAYEWGLISGTSTTTFSPEGSITRGEFITGLGLVAGISTAAYAGATGFSDVAATDSYAPYVCWAKQTGITAGVGGGQFGPNETLSLSQLLTMSARFLDTFRERLPWLDASAEYTAFLKEGTAPAARQALMYQMGVLPEETSALDAAAPATRAQVAAVYAWLNRLRWGNDLPVVNSWQEYVPLTEDAVPTVEDPVVSAASIIEWVAWYGLDASSTMFEALCRINTEYADDLSAEDRSHPLVFLFEGAGGNSNPGVRMNALCVVVQDGEITYLNQNSSTIPDDPFDPWKNDGTDMPTLMSGIYTYSSTNQGYYAALHVNDARVVRFSNETSFYASTSVGINIHRRSQNEIAPEDANWGNSVGCCLVGFSGAQAGGEYAKFIAAVGLVPQGSSGDTSYYYNVTGKVVVDRSFAREYLTNVGYPSEAIDLIG